MSSIFQSYKKALPSYNINFNARHNIIFREFIDRPILQRWTVFINNRGKPVNGIRSGYIRFDILKKIIQPPRSKINVFSKIAEKKITTLEQKEKKATIVDDIYDVTPTFTGKYVEYYDDGSLQLAVSYVDGKRNGKTIEMYKDGTIWRTFDYVNDTPVGKSIWHYPEGYLQAEITFDNLNEGYGLFYDFEGNVIAEGLVVENDGDVILNDVITGNVLYSEDINNILNSLIDKYEKDVEEEFNLLYPEDEEDESELSLEERPIKQQFTKIEQRTQKKEDLSIPSNLSMYNIPQTKMMTPTPQIKPQIKVNFKPNVVNDKLKNLLKK